MNNLIIAVVAWYIAEGCGLMQWVRWKLCVLNLWYKLDAMQVKQQRRIKPFDCESCMGLWLGMFVKLDYTSMYIGFTFSPIDAILCSSIAIFISKIYNRL